MNNSLEPVKRRHYSKRNLARDSDRGAFVSRNGINFGEVVSKYASNRDIVMQSDSTNKAKFTQSINSLLSDLNTPLISAKLELKASGAVSPLLRVSPLSNGYVDVSFVVRLSGTEQSEHQVTLVPHKVEQAFDFPVLN